MAKSEFDQAEFMRTLERLAREQGYGDGNLRPDFDLKEFHERTREAADGLKIEDYRQCLDNQRMRFVPAKRLGFYPDGRPHQEGLWFHPDLHLQIAFTDRDLLTLFQGPQDLWEWIERRKLEYRAGQAGLSLPPN